MPSFGLSPCREHRFPCEAVPASHKKGGEEMLHHFPVIIMRFIIDLRHNQIPIKPENRIIPAFADRLHRIVVDMSSGIPRFLLHFNNALQKTGRDPASLILYLGLSIVRLISVLGRPSSKSPACN